MHDELQASPAKSLLIEIDQLEKLIELAAHEYLKRLKLNLEEAELKIKPLASKNKLPAEVVRDIRDLIAMLRSAKVKPDKAKRKELKKLEDLVHEIKELTASW